MIVCLLLLLVAAVPQYLLLITASVVSIYNKKRAMRSKSKVKSCWFVQSDRLFCQQGTLPNCPMNREDNHCNVVSGPVSQSIYCYYQIIIYNNYITSLKKSFKLEVSRPHRNCPKIFSSTQMSCSLHFASDSKMSLIYRLLCFYHQSLQVEETEHPVMKLNLYIWKKRETDIITTDIDTRQQYRPEQQLRVLTSCDRKNYSWTLNT